MPPDRSDSYLDYVTEESTAAGMDMAVYGNDGEDVQRLLEKTRENELERLYRLLDDVDRQLETREAVYEYNVAEVRDKLSRYENRLETLRTHHRKADEREELRYQVRRLEEELREARERFWNDRQTLLEERRELMREVMELESDPLQDIL